MADQKLVDALLAQVKASIDHEIEDEHIERVRNGIEDKLNQGARLREHPIENADEPNTIFRTYREEA